MIIDDKEYQWRSLGDLDEIIQAVCMSWVNTPYVKNQRTRGAGCDCKGLINGAYDQLEGVTHYLTRRAPDSGVHTDEEGEAAMWEMIQVYDAAFVTDQVLEPGDTVITKAEISELAPDRKSHAALITGEPFKIIEASGDRVHKSSFQALSNIKIQCILRPDKSRWIK